MMHEIFNPICLFTGNVVSFETNMLEELSETVLEPVAGFSEDAFEVGLETADTAFDGTATGAEVAFNKRKFFSTLQQLMLSTSPSVASLR